jgi:phospholipid transport system substrate-binding protein
MLKQLFLSVALLLGVQQVHAQPQKPDVVLKETTEKMRDLIRQNHKEYTADKNKFYSVVDEVLVPVFDVRYIAQLTLGKNWRNASEQQRSRFADAFKTSLIRTYADALLANYDSVDAKYEPLRMPANATDVTVRVQLMRANVKKPVAMAFAMREADSQWKIYDVIIENLSLITNFRSQFTSEIKKSGLDALITKMEAGNYFQQNPPKGS